MRVHSVSLQKRRKISRELRDKIVLDHLSLVKAIAIRVHENLPVHVDLDDLVHAGVLGLFDAVEKYDNSRNVAFQAYAKHRIKGAILDSLRQLDWASRDLRKRQKDVESLTRELSTELGRTPNENEMADRMGVSLDRWRRIMAELRTTGPVVNAEQESSRAREFSNNQELQPDHVCDRRQLQHTLARAISVLPERYQKVVFLYYTDELTMKQIGELMGVNESRISQIHKTALRKMAVALKSEGIESAGAFEHR